MTKYRMGRARRAAVVLVAAGLTATGCTVDGDSAAQIGSSTVSQSQVSDRTDATLSNPLPAQGGAASADRSTVNRDELTFLIRHELIRDLATTWRVPVDDAVVQSTIAQAAAGGVTREAIAGQLGVTDADLETAVFDTLVLSEVAGVVLESGWQGDVVTIEIDGVAARDEADAQLLRARLLGPSADQVLTERADSLIQRQTMVSADPAAAWAVPDGVFGADEGDVLIIDDGGQLVVIRILERTVENTETDLTGFASLSGAEALSALTPLLLTDQAKQTGVTVNPRFGRWDPVAVAVVR